MSLASMSSFAGEDDLASTMFPRLEAQLREAEKGFTSTMLRFCPDRMVMESEVLARAKATNEVRKIHGFHVICPLVCLPSEVLVTNILRRLDPVSLCRVSMTCTFLYELASDNLLWRGLYDEWERKWENVSRKVRTFGVYMSDSELLFAASDDDDGDADDDGSDGDDDDDGDDGDSSDELDDDTDKERNAVDSDDGDDGGQKEYEEMKEDDGDDEDDDGDEKVGHDDSDEQLQLNASESEGDDNNMEIERPKIKIGSNRTPNRLPKRKANAKQKTKSKAKAKTVKRTKEEKRPPGAIKKTQATRAKAKSPAAALINSSPAGPYSGKIVSFSAFSNTSASDVPTKRKGSAIIGVGGGGGGATTALRSKGLEFDSAADNLYSNPAPPLHRVQAMAREESDGERREREKMVHDMQREWRRLLDRVARREAHDERAHAFYWKHCFRELELQALNRKKKDVSARKRGALHKLLARPGTNLSLQAAVFPLPLKWLLAKETAAAAAAAAAAARQRDGSKTRPVGAATSPRARRGSVSATNGFDESPFQSIVSKVFENNKRLFSLRIPFDAFDEDAQNRPGNLPPNEEWLHFGRLREVRGGDSLLEIIFSVKGDERDIQKQRANTLTFIKEVRAVLGGEIEGIWEDVDYGFGGGDSHRLVVFSTPGRKGLLLQWSWENNSNLLQPWHQ